MDEAGKPSGRSGSFRGSGPRGGFYRGARRGGGGYMEGKGWHCNVVSFTFALSHALFFCGNVFVLWHVLQAVLLAAWFYA